ncbi:MFS transporter [Pendulispora albinea]|uniref:MFS transporter n=1 Tax=Pendulispora albinea TaxID=2741071 RepID=A0ABZ2M8U2_9BACT
MTTPSMAVTAGDPAAAPRSLLRALLPLCAFLFLCYSTIAIPLPLLPGQVHDVLGFDALMVAVVIGIQSLATLATRHTVGTLTDRRGPAWAVVAGAATSSLAGLVYLASVPFAAGAPTVSLLVLILGRLVLGLGESLAMTGVLVWGIGLVGKERAGRAMAWIGISMYGAFAVNAPLGAFLGKTYGFGGAALLAVVAPIVALGAVFATPKLDASRAAAVRVPFHRVIGIIWRQGLGLAFATLGFGALSAFGPLYYQAHGWPDAAFALSAFGAAYILARLFFATLPDRFGGARTAVVFLSIEIVGQLVLWRASSPSWAALGATLTGFGFSLVFPSLGVEAVRRAPPESRGVVLGGYVAFFDVSIGLLVPLAGVLVRAMGFSFAFVLGAASAALALALTWMASARARTGAGP